ncbi:hypothetical protein HK096_010103 [Nowakowskiella sp. JEL0078]|nr:hypothetical protein HK096_010103 [Nowakowskiella sp. JEL0078]
MAFSTINKPHSLTSAFESTPPSGTADYVSPHPYFPPGYGMPAPYFPPITSSSESVNKRPVTKETTTAEVNSDMSQKKGKGCPLKCKSIATDNGSDLSPDLSEKPATPASWTNDQIKHLLECYTNWQSLFLNTKDPRMIGKAWDCVQLDFNGRT